MDPAPKLSLASDPTDFPENHGWSIGWGDTDSDGDLNLGIDANQEVLRYWIDGDPSDLRFVLGKGPDQVEAVIYDGFAHRKAGVDQSPVADVERGLQPVSLDLNEVEVFRDASAARPEDSLDQSTRYTQTGSMLPGGYH